jgi:hypothetical protein
MGKIIAVSSPKSYYPRYKMPPKYYDLLFMLYNGSLSRFAYAILVGRVVILRLATNMSSSPADILRRCPESLGLKLDDSKRYVRKRCLSGIRSRAPNICVRTLYKMYNSKASERRYRNKADPFSSSSNHACRPWLSCTAAVAPIGQFVQERQSLGFEIQPPRAHNIQMRRVCR